MAPTTSSEAVSRQQRSILTLDKSDEPFEVQIVHACNILDIDIHDEWNNFPEAKGQQASRVHTTFDPRAEWTLKWLLKKFKAAKKESPSPCLYSKAWSLLRELTVRIPLSKTASLLKTYDFITIVRNTLRWFYESENKRLSAPNGEGQGSLHTSDDSSGTVSSSPGELRTSRKRKRNGTVSADGNGAIDALFMAVCATIAQIWSFMEDPDHGRGFIVEHIKSAVRSSPQDAAQILGIGLYLTNHSLRKPNRASEQEWSTTSIAQNQINKTACSFYVSSAVELWSTRSPSRQDPYNTESNLAFRAHCMMPALKLLNRCREWSPLEKDIEAVTGSLEEMLIKHVILPYRASKIDTETPGQVSAGGTSISLSQDLVAVLTPFRLPLLGEANVSGGNKSNLERSIRKTDAQNTITLLSLLFDVALNSCPRSTPKLRRAEDAWLEQLFAELAECAAMFLPSKVKIYHAMLVKWMMKKAVKYKLRLSSPTIEAILYETSGLFNRDTDLTVQWSVIGLCLQIDANVFITLDTEDLEEGKCQRIPNKYLLSLLSNITEGQLETSQDYDHVLSYIIIPLCNAFADARDLGSFIDIWTEQLSIVLRRNTAQNDFVASAPGIWEDEQLLRSVAQLVATSLTPASMERIMSRAIDDLTMISQHVMNDRVVSPAALVILDCLFAGISHEEAVARLTETAGSAFRISGISNTELSPQTDRWRMWRIKATIADRWVTLHESPTFKRNAQISICAAFELINLIPSKISANEIEDLSEEFHAFRFMLRFAAMEDSFWTELHSPSRSDLAAAVRTILDAMEPFCHRISHDHFQTIKLPDSVPQWDEFAVKVTSIDTLYLRCVADIITSPGILSYLDADIQARLIEQLYWCAVYQQRSSQSMPIGSIDYSWPWKMLHQPDVLGEHTSTTRYLRSFQVDHYLVASKFGEPKYWDAEMADYVVAFKSIQAIPVQALERGHRSVIANRILRILLYATIPSLAITAEHLTMLAKLLTMPNKSMDILVNAEESKKGLVETGDGAVLIRLARGIDCTMGWSEDNVYAVNALRRLTSSVMSHLCTTFNQRSSMEYLNIFYDQLAGLLEDTHDNKTSCSTALAAMIETSLNEYSKHHDIVGDSFRTLTETLKTTRLYHLESLLTSFQEISITGASDQTHRLGIILECLAGYADLLSVHPSLGEISARLFGADGLSGTLKRKSHVLQRENIASNRPFVNGHGFEYLTARLARIELLLNARNSKLHPNIVETSTRLYHMNFAKEKKKLLDSLRDLMPTLSPQSKAQCCFEHDLEADRCLSYVEVYLLGMAIVSTKDQEIQEFRESISRTFTLLCRGLFQPIPFRDSMLTMQCISLLLQKHPRLITQWHIDNLLSAITAKSASLKEKIEDKHSAMLYIGLCRLFSNILAIHRTKTGGRYHLIILALQSLLRCLFTPYNPTKPSSAFTVTHASTFARLLTTICDPTVSSVTRSKKRSRLDLNDETKKAKSIAGQHLPYLIMEYCQCQLKGRLVPEMKAALEPGLHAVLSVMTLEVMKMMNAALDESGRAVWKAFYEDFRRLGVGGGV